ncbi:MAG: UDP-3-O-(3-hydroxymyristoyl)glucosamine N-acyltransferase [Bacteroidales bacterium]|nr:UDP-3-O-(3-hydroxymyristoyl)glucosamine N-acyltransferase [Bacteroidales bacterium]
MEFTATQIAGFINGAIEGNPDVKVSNLSKIEEGQPGTLTFLANPKYHPFLYSTKASIVIVDQDFVPAQPVEPTLIHVENPYASFARLMEMFAKSKSGKEGISATAVVSSSATLGPGISIGDFTYIGDGATIGSHVCIHPQVYIGPHVKIEENTVIYPGVKIYSDCIIGKNCILHGGVVIGSDGFGFAPQSDNSYQKIPQLGNVILEENVEVGSNTTIDRATMGSTIIRRGVKLDNLIQVAHNVEIGENTVIAAQTGISGSTRIGKNCMIGGQVGIVGHIIIADNVKIGAGSGIEASILEEGMAMLGAPAIDARKARRNFIHWRKLDEIVKTVYSLEKQVNRSHE